jgi:flagellar export protein FliJ
VGAFRLERLLRLRAQLRTLRQLEAQQIEGERDRLDGTRAALDAARRALLDETERAFAAGAVDGGDLAVIRGYESALRERTARVDEDRTATRARLVAKREQLGGERREERKLEHLEERHRSARAAEALLAGERLLDELVLGRHVRERGEERRGK